MSVEGYEMSHDPPNVLYGEDFSPKQAQMLVHFLLGRFITLNGEARLVTNIDWDSDSQEIGIWTCASPPEPPLPHLADDQHVEKHGQRSAGDGDPVGPGVVDIPAGLL